MVTSSLCRTTAGPPREAGFRASARVLDVGDDGDTVPSMGAHRRRGLVLCVLLPAVAAGTTACASSPDRHDVRQAATTFVRALLAADGPRACQLLTSDARRSASGATDTACGDAVLSIVEQDDKVHGVQVWGDAAQVRIAGDVIFLRRISGSWKVSAAGCKPQPPGPYECMVGS
jgi:hypothetical protein